MKGTHEEFVHIPGLGNAFITGVPDKCNHNDQGIAFILGNGEILLERKYRCPTHEATHEYVTIVAERKGTFISGQTCVCTKCDKVHTLADLMGDAYWD